MTSPASPRLDDEQQALTSYYDGIAATYDDSRFGNSYGRYLDGQERGLLRRLLPAAPGARVLDLACGTGRLLSFASLGVDASAEMLGVARQRAGDRPLIQASATRLPLDDGSLDAVFSLHFFMHLSRPTLDEVLRESHRVLRPGGVLVFDIPSATRRRLLGQRRSGWHGSTSLSFGDVRAAAEPDWQLASRGAVLMLPVHRLPTRLRAPLRQVDSLLCASPLMPLASYLFVQLRKPG
ncbi:MAG: class I SAM-dependent methyltransferase [Burkholderiales bacterium]|nr:MAG: class I SAM-dependent methyltransferase [Burkholderiales bacterium]